MIGGKYVCLFRVTFDGGSSRGDLLLGVARQSMGPASGHYRAAAAIFEPSRAMPAVLQPPPSHGNSGHKSGALLLTGDLNSAQLLSPRRNHFSFRVVGSAAFRRPPISQTVGPLWPRYCRCGSLQNDPSAAAAAAARTSRRRPPAKRTAFGRRYVAVIRLSGDVAKWCNRAGIWCQRGRP